MNSVIIDMKSLLVTFVPKWVFGNNLFIARTPPLPNRCVTLFDIKGTTPDLGLAKESYFRDAFQCVVRDINYETAMGYAWEIANTLQGLHNVYANSTTYTLIRLLTIPEVMEWDTNNRVSLVFSMEAQRR